MEELRRILHSLSNVLTNVCGHAELASISGSEEDTREHLDAVMQQCMKATALNQEAIEHCLEKKAERRRTPA